jgi:hypothetical protein
MATRSKQQQDDAPKRLNRAVGIGDVLGKALDFASRDLIAHWTAMAPPPYDRVAAPDRLAWPRGEKSASGATLYLRALPGHALAIQHEGERIAAAINRYFGYVLVGAVRLSPEPLTLRQPPAPPNTPLTETPHPRADAEVAAVADDGLRDALRRQGRGIMGSSRR